MKYPALPGEMEIIIYHYTYLDYVPTGRRERHTQRETEIEIGITFTLLIRHPNIAEEFHMTERYKM